MSFKYSFNLLSLFNLFYKCPFLLFFLLEKIVSFV